MRRYRTIWLVTLAALLGSWAAPHAFASWQCEGRTCGTSPWACCCIAPDGARDANCGSESSGAAAAGSAACPSGCNCVMTVRAADATRTSAGLHAASPVFHPALLPAVPVPAGPLPSETVARSIDPRGPPPRRALLGTPSLRGPPASPPSPLGF